MLSKNHLNSLEYEVMGACIEVHKHLGPGLLESVYHQCLVKEFELREIPFSSQHPVLVDYKGYEIDTVLKADFLIYDIFLLEIKAVEELLPIHYAQTLTYMKLLKSPKGLLVNFNTTNLYHQGRKPFVNDLFRDLPE
ncbi:GxxExxY protein [Foetidibacter luteolus]|uniref:GxxExxY protein n=1 Tax=Foetidibacter luteolus TaxID=2608880 RepID=UPI00129A52C2|nr:GxxExxY protein [Foetidibacter luteolus]